ncbi:type II toxin-antitoxin system MqsR family toxin [Pseudomonas gingeri]|uniref:type II toxin-antitoxin system MqsR family toxin n=2 Tax=Pseudomonas gingeri TaxID=117681 RepID=UPI0015A26C72|nr:type II toxin-antitoxin system MqsR family toxin [Pseudomonas gingeri]NVZ99086.1 type II toxin-antitoxin system MqsR family toxin [Pseudomonas gingeri]NWA13131.1 type II toxin-antitoxin system MqsR family toxin [Pseudomonas gingeri]NWA55392.1 type II toxin-antitoxin system MqsR family toxin [Pseudomonas gingeri]NWA95754.1 type II toxin-antitoxin system MqsR family toxin [Pseudomonas gingeri]NWB00842.1 type II toxin-antitoxin system MqsR family toxin [Pseudomonas gingeri]
MENKTPHCRLSPLRTLIAAGRVKSTSSALVSAAALGLGFEEMIGIVLTPTARDFHKSMTTHADHRIWQDVYRPSTVVGQIYLKLTVIDDVLIVSFKEL